MPDPTGVWVNQGSVPWGEGRLLPISYKAGSKLPLEPEVSCRVGYTSQGECEDQNNAEGCFADTVSSH